MRSCQSILKREKLPHDLYQFLKRDRVLAGLYATSVRCGVCVYLVGGFLRDLFVLSGHLNVSNSKSAGNDTLFDAPIKYPLNFDYDVVVTHNVKRFCEALASEIGGSLFPLDKKRGVYRLLTEGKTLRYSPFDNRFGFKDGVQIDVSLLSDGDIWADLAKRDFSVNALAVSLKEIFDDKVFIIDPFNGLRDIKEKILKVTVKWLSTATRK